MKAIIWTAYGPPEVLQLREIEKPTPKDNEVLIKVRAATVNLGDCELRSLKLPLMYRLPIRLFAGLAKPKRITIPGQELSGEIETVGKMVTTFKPGDPVFAATGFGMGAYAEYVCLPVGEADVAVCLKPSNMSFEEAAAVPFGGLDALHFLSKANIQRGQKVLINGAGGSIGTFAVQLAHDLGAEITAVDTEAKLEMLRTIGARHTIDYTREDFTKNGETYDVIFDVVGKSPFAACLKALKKNGWFIIANPGPSHMIRGTWANLWGNKHVFFKVNSANSRNLEFLKKQIEAGKLKTVIHKRYRLEQIQEAHRFVETGQKAGNVIITIP